MLRPGTNRFKSGSAPLQRIDATEGNFYVDVRGRVRKRSRLMRMVGNFLIFAGLLMLLGIGGWYGYTYWQNERFKEEFVSKGYDFNPTAGQVATPSPAIDAPTPLPVLSNTGLSQAVGTAPRKVDASPPVRVIIPSVKIDSPVVPITWAMIPAPGGGLKSEWQVADYAVGHHAGSAFPGQIGNVVLSGHVDYKGQVFKDLINVKKGDEVVVATEKGQYLYVVDNIVIVQEEGVPEEQKRRNAMYMDPTPDQTLTMITCWPYGIDTHRLIVIAKPYQSTLSTQSEFVIR